MLEYHSRLERHTSMQRILLASCQRRSNICSALRKNFIFFQKPAWQIAKWVYIKTVITDKVMIPKWRGSSVGRAEDWKSSCHQFDPGPCHHFFALTPDGDTPFGFFLASFWGWIARIYDFSGKTENLKLAHSGGLKNAKIPQILRLAILGDTGICQVVNALLTAYFLKNLSCFLVSPMSAKENFVLRTAVLWVFFLTIKELQENQRFLFSSQMRTGKQMFLCHRLLSLIFAAADSFSSNLELNSILAEVFCFSLEGSLKI